MKSIMEKNQASENLEITSKSQDTTASSETRLMTTYIEWEDQSVKQISEIEYLHQQMNQLSLLQQKTSFLVREVGYLLKAD